MTAIVTGAAGFLGRHVVSALLAEGEVVIGFDNFATSDPEDLEALGKEPRFEFFEQDVSSAEFRKVLDDRLGSESVSEIFHLACPTGVPNLGPMALEMLETCYDGTRNALEAAGERGARLVLASSAEVYGNPTVSPQTEDYTGNVDTLGPRKGYEEGKRVAETLCGIYAERYGVPAVIARIFNTYGPGMSLSETRVVPAFVRAALLGESLVVHGDGGQLRCHSFSSDTVNGLRLAMRHGTPGRAYNIGSQHAMSVRSLAEKIIAMTGTGCAIRYQDRPSHDHDARLPSTERAQTELGWAPTTSLERGLDATIADIRARLGVPGRTLIRGAA
jgi:nucleoside-diphosphate-sugar epimerase